MTAVLSCSRCKGPLQAGATACPRCGLRVATVAASGAPTSAVTPARTTPQAAPTFPPEAFAPAGPARPDSAPGPPAQEFPSPGGTAGRLADSGPSEGTATGDGLGSRRNGPEETTFLRGTGPLNASALPAQPAPSESTPYLASTGGTGPLGAVGNTGPLLHTGPLRTGPFDQSVLAQAPGTQTGPIGKQTPRGALELLPQESVAFQLGALYLTTKRVILLAPSVIRSAFIRDIDAVGTFTERASGWYLFGAVLMLAGTGLSVFLSFAAAAQELRLQYPWLYIIDPIWFGLLLVAGAVLTLVRYFFHVKRTLFISVRGRPLITVSIADWNTRKLEGMDSFVNAFFQIKDHMTGELDARQLEGR